MLYKKKGLPEESDIVMCTVTKVMYNSVFAKLDDYGFDGMIHISEVSPGRIRNIRDFVKEGKKVVCKVLRVNKARNQVDLSMRRVNDSQRRKKVDEVKQEQKAEKIIEYVAKQLKLDFEKLYKEIAAQVLEDYEYLHQFFFDIVNDEGSFDDYKLDKKTADELKAIIKQRLKPVNVTIKGSLNISSKAPDGVEIVKAALEKGMVDEGIEMKYMGAGKYDLMITAPDYKIAEELLEKSTKLVLDEIETKGGEGSFSREK